MARDPWRSRRRRLRQQVALRPADRPRHRHRPGVAVVPYGHQREQQGSRQAELVVVHPQGQVAGAPGDPARGLRCAPGTRGRLLRGRPDAHHPERLLRRRRYGHDRRAARRRRHHAGDRGQEPAAGRVSVEGVDRQDPWRHRVDGRGLQPHPHEDAAHRSRRAARRGQDRHPRQRHGRADRRGHQRRRAQPPRGGADGDPGLPRARHLQRRLRARRAPGPAERPSH